MTLVITLSLSLSVLVCVCVCVCVLWSRHKIKRIRSKSSQLLLQIDQGQSYLRGIDTFQGGHNSAKFFCLPSEKGSTLEGKNLGGSNFFSFRLDWGLKPVLLARHHENIPI